jgi:hypothetical protein
MEVSDPVRVARERVIGLVRSLPLLLVGAMSMFLATGIARGEEDPWRAVAPWAIAGVSFVALLFLRYADLRTSRVWLAEDGLVVQSLRGKFTVPYAEVEGARIGRTPFGLPSRHPGYVRVRLRRSQPFVGRWVTTIAPTRAAAVRSTKELASRVEKALAPRSRSAVEA